MKELEEVTEVENVTKEIPTQIFNDKEAENVQEETLAEIAKEISGELDEQGFVAPENEESKAENDASAEETPKSEAENSEEAKNDDDASAEEESKEDASAEEDSKNEENSDSESESKDDSSEGGESGDADEEDDFSGFGELEEEPKKKHPVIKGILIGLGALAAGALIGTYTFFVVQHSSHFMKGTTINDIEVGGLTVEQAEDMIQGKLKDYSLDVKFAETDEMIKGTDIDYVYNLGDSVRNVLDGQNEFLWFEEFFLINENDIDVTTTYSEDKLARELNSFEELKKDKMRAPADSKVAFVDGKFIVTEADNGTTLDAKRATDEIKKAIEDGDTSLDLKSVKDLYSKAKINSDDKDLNNKANELNKSVGASITYILPSGEKRVLDSNVFLTWLVDDGNGVYHKDDNQWNAKIDEYIAQLKKDVDTVYKNHTFVTTDGRTIQIPGTGYYGWNISTDQERQELIKNISNGEKLEREPIYLTREVTTENYGFGKDYIELDLSKQHLWLYQGGVVTYETDVVSGTNDGKHMTPAGAFITFNKQRDKIMRGEKKPDGTYEYETPAKFWIRITNTGIGLHDAPWRGAFGGQIWKTNGSHGCVNLPPKAAEDLYNMVPNGTPVAIYY